MRIQDSHTRRTVWDVWNRAKLYKIIDITTSYNDIWDIHIRDQQAGTALNIYGTKMKTEANTLETWEQLRTSS